MRNIVVGVQGVADREPALDFAIDEAVRRRLPLQVVHAYQVPVYGEAPVADLPQSVRGIREAAHATAEAALVRARNRVPGGETVAVQLAVLESDPATALLTKAEPAALLVVGSRGANALVRGVLGSVSAACLHRGWAPVAVVPHHRLSANGRFPVNGKAPQPDDSTGLTRRVLVALDGSPASLTALSWATAQAREWGCALTPVVVSPSRDQMPAGLRSMSRTARNDLMAIVAGQVADAGGSDLEVRPLFLVGDPGGQLLAALEPADLLVMGSRGRGALASVLLGSTSLTLAESAPCPVVVVRQGQARREIHQRIPYTVVR